MKLTDPERNIIVGAQLCANESIRVIASRVGYREHVVRHCLKRLEERGILSTYPFVNPYALGYQTVSVFFSLAASGEQRKKFVQGLLQRPQVSWLDECIGEYQFSVALQVRNIAEVSRFFEELSQKYGRIFFEKAIVILVSGALFPRTYLATKKMKIAPLICGDLGTEVAEVDEVDHKILAGLSQLQYRSYRDLAKQIAVPESTVKYRVAQLMEAKVISGFCYAVHPEAFGYSDFYYLISAKAISSQFKNALYDFCHRHPNVYAFMNCIGAWDYECKADFPSAKEASELLYELHDAFPEDIRTIKVLQYRRSKKMAFYPFSPKSS